MLRIFPSTFLLFLLLLLTACGYHLRGELDLPDNMKTVYIEGASAGLKDQFKSALLNSSVRLVNSRADAGTIIIVSDEDTLKRALSLGTGGYANQYGLEYHFSFEVLDGNGKTVVPLQPVEIRREYFNNQQLILGKDNEEIVIRNEMYQQAVRTMINQIRAGLGTKQSDAP
ncbi:LPS-assembly lipoprotein LptE [uncultured bacterium]|nr:LPS-assembly lipoprotein LptE [uncultured bacterium]